MKYPERCTNIIDVTKPPYCADNTGKTDCTAILRRILDDVLIRHIEATEDFASRLWSLSENGTKDVYVGFECGRVVSGRMRVTMPDLEPSTKIIYFPVGTYLVSDTITYTLNDLKNKYYSCPDYDLSRNIHFLGEDREKTVIRLADHSPGFERGSMKPMLSFNTTEAPRNKEVSNTCQMCMLEDITLDMGRGNGGVGVKYHSSNNGRIENVTICSECGVAGIYTVFGSEASLVNLKIRGFDYGMDIAYSSLISIDGADLSDNRCAGILTNDSAVTLRNIDSGETRTICFREGKTGRYYLGDDSVKCGPANGNFIYRYKEKTSGGCEIPKNKLGFERGKVAFVDDYGATADGSTDATDALRAAMSSGKPIVLFGEGRYLINGAVKIPAHVRYVDFNFCELVSGDRLVSGEVDCAFEIAEASNSLLFIENLYTQEPFYGMMRLLKQSCVRDVVLSDLQVSMAALYFNTIGGSRLYLDNIFVTTGSYCDNRCLRRPGVDPIYSAMIPLEIHGQTVYGRGVNFERANVAILNDRSSLILDGFRTEGPGTAVRTVNGGKTEIHLFHAGIGDRQGARPLFDSDESHMDLCGIRAIGYNAETVYHTIIKQRMGGNDYVFCWEDAKNHPTEYAMMVHGYCSARAEQFE